VLKRIPGILSPELVKILMEMGHGDEIVLADANFPAASHAQRLVRCDGHPIPPLLDAVLSLFPLDSFVKQPVALMCVIPGDWHTPDIWPTYEKIVRNHEPSFSDFERMEYRAFYERAKNAYAIVASGETGRYANILLRKGVI